jgi:hypothetical protein
MLTSSAFQLVAVQAVIFTPDHGSFSQSSVLASILGRFSQRFNGPVQALPLPEDVPVEVPRVLLRSSDRAWTLQAGPARIDSLWHQRDLSSAVPDDVVAHCSEVLAHYVASSHTKVARLALVITRASQVPEPAPELVSHFCNEAAQQGPFRHSVNFEIHNHKRYTLAGGPEVNSWVRCKTGQLTVSEASVVLVEQDINTVEEIAYPSQFDPSGISGYFQRVAAEMDSILQIYFR